MGDVVLPIEVYDYHHLDPSVKEGGIANLLIGAGWDRIQEELDKCVLLCAIGLNI